MRARCRVTPITAVMCLIASAAATADGIDELDDAAARMQYAFHTDDVRGVEEALNIVQKVTLPASMQGMKEYFTAYGQWKLAELHTDQVNAGQRASRGAATKAAAACVRAAEEAARLDPRFAEPHALEAICSALSSRAPDLLTGGCAKHKGLRTAQELAPGNPRVLLIEAQCLATPASKADAAHIERLRRVVQAFENAPPSQPGRPSWGQAEALLMLGVAYVERGDSSAARDPIERSLVIAPDYNKAREALRNASSRGR
jgi:hypothetical protein